MFEQCAGGRFDGKLSPQRGFTLVELMIVVAVIALLSGIALPVYQGYIQSSREGTLLSSIATIRVFQEDYKLRKGAYAGGSYSSGTADADLAKLGWDPETDNIDFVVVANTDVSYQVTATDESGVSVCRKLPDDDPC